MTKRLRKTLYLLYDEFILNSEITKENDKITTSDFKVPTFDWVVICNVLTPTDSKKNKKSRKTAMYVVNHTDTVIRQVISPFKFWFRAIKFVGSHVVPLRLVSNIN